MKSASPAKQHSEMGASPTPFIVEAEFQARSQEPFEHPTVPLPGVDSLAETASVVETLELTARLLGALEIPVTNLTLDRGGFLMSWQPQTFAREVESSRKVASISARSDAASMEIHYRGEVNQLTKRAAGAILKAAVIQTERCSRRAWQFAPPGQVSAKARDLEADIERVARLPYGVLITGETGTGKTRTAREIHRRSARASRPFMELNCASLPEQLAEAELFGYRRGAFTGADRDHKGVFEESDGGTLFLDEIGDLPPAVQNKLLKAIDEKQIKRLGTNRYVSCEVRIIAATSRDLPSMIREGTFREDLYCRLAVLEIEIAPLRERREEIPALIALFLREAAGNVSRLSGGEKEYQLESGAVELMCAADWSGNVRVLRNTIFELTSFVREGEAVTMELARAALARLHARGGCHAPTGVTSGRGVSPTPDVRARLTTEDIADALRSRADEGDIVLPVEACILRRDETLRQWVARVKQLGIEATRRAGGARTMREAAERLGLSHEGLKGHRRRARSIS